MVHRNFAIRSSGNMSNESEFVVKKKKGTEFGLSRGCGDGEDSDEDASNSPT